MWVEKTLYLCTLDRCYLKTGRPTGENVQKTSVFKERDRIESWIYIKKNPALIQLNCLLPCRRILTSPCYSHGTASCGDWSIVRTNINPMCWQLCWKNRGRSKRGECCHYKREKQWLLTSVFFLRRTPFCIRCYSWFCLCFFLCVTCSSNRQSLIAVERCRDSDFECGGILRGKREKREYLSSLGSF